MNAKISLVGCGMVLFVLLTLTGCQTSRYHMEQDKGPETGFDASNVPDAEPIYEVRTVAGNKSPYTVNGKTYHVLGNTEGFKEHGVASWYGKKFHGYQTSNGEVYNMYGMTAAHKALPIPSYVRVTNLENGRQVVVRVNDRGPFHDGRVIDLSYAAAQKLGYATKGTASVRVEIVPMPAPGEGGVASSIIIPGTYYVQAAAFASRESAMRLKGSLATIVSDPVSILETDAGGAVVYRVRLGPYSDKASAEAVRHRLVKSRIAEPMLVNESG